MPIYEYAAVDKGCAYCAARFELLQKLRDDPLTRCPECGAAVIRVISAPSVAVGGAHLLKESHAEKHGFTQYRRAGKGVYEKTIGKGPKFISDK
jgi:putative FmdB family regulatory protein